METTNKTLASGKVLKITLGTHLEGEDLWIAIMEEAKTVGFKSEDEIFDPNLLKDLFCTAMASRKIRAAVKPLLARCTYDNEKITDLTFNPSESRMDYFEVLEEVIKVNVAPFVKGLVRKYEATFITIKQIIQRLKSEEKETSSI